MCNRFVIEYPEQVNLWSKEMLEWEWRELVNYYNAAPSQRLPVVLLDSEGKSQGRLIAWGVQVGGSPQRYMNARSETVLSSNLWKNAAQGRRCVVLADAYYEWPPEPAPKTPWLFRRTGHRPFAFAGLHFPGSSPEADTFAFLTTEANAMTGAIGHPRSPVMLDESNVREWFRPGPLTAGQLEPLCRPYPAGQMERFRVTRRLNNPRFNGPECVQPLSPEQIAAEDGAGTLSAERPNGEQLNLL